MRAIHGVGQILLVGEAQQHRVAQLVLVQHAMQLVARLADAVAIVTVHHEDQTLRVLEVVPPQGADLRAWGGKGLSVRTCIEERLHEKGKAAACKSL